MRMLITGTSGRLGAALAQHLARAHMVIGLDVAPGQYTTHRGSITNRSLVFSLAQGMDAIMHTASLLPPHMQTTSRSAFVETIVQGTLNLLEGAVEAGVSRFVYTSTTSLYGHAMDPCDRAVWVTEALPPVPRDLYDVTKLAAEGLCRDVAAAHGLPCVILRVARSFPEPAHALALYRLYKGVDIRDVIVAHALALESTTRGCEVFNIAAQSPFDVNEAAELLHDAPQVILRHFPAAGPLFSQLGWRFPTCIDRVYVIEKAVRELGYRPRFNFAHCLTEARRTAGQGH